MRALARVAALLALATAAAAPAAAQVPLPPLPPVGGQPPGQPPGERPPPQQPPPAHGPVSQAPGSVTRGVDVAQTGHLPDTRLVPPLVRRWRVAAKPFQVLAADGRVYSIEGGGVVAFDLGTGRELWRAALADSVQGAAYDGGRLFVSTFDDIHALDAQTGAVAWKQHLLDVAFASAPVASGGVVYVAHGQGGGTLHAFRGGDGSVVWRKGAPSGMESVALDNDRAYAAGACANAQAYNRSNGETVWTHTTGCSGGGDVTPALHGGRLYVPDQEYTGGEWLDPPILSAADGKGVGRFQGARPVFVENLALFRRGDDGVTAVDLASGRDAWRVRGSTGSMISVGPDVYAVQGDRWKVFDSETGRELWAQRLPGGDSDGSSPAAVLGAAPGMLLVASGGRLEAHGPFLEPGPREVGLAFYADVTAGQKALLAGVVGSELRGARPQVAIERARWRRGGFKRAATAPTARDGGFTRRIAITRNTRFRALAAGVASNVVTVYAWPSVKLGRPYALGGGRIRQGVTVRAPVPIGGRTFALYLDRHKTKGLRLLGTARLRGGRTARAVLAYRDTTRFDKRDFVWFCVRGQLALELGRPEPLTKRCGARSLPEPDQP